MNWMRWPLHLVEFWDENVIGEEFAENWGVFVQMEM